jgi:TolB-like protein
MEVASEEKMAFPLPEKPSIAVLPFDNLTGDPQQEYQLGVHLQGEAGEGSEGS